MGRWLDPNRRSSLKSRGYDLKIAKFNHCDNTDSSGTRTGMLHRFHGETVADCLIESLLEAVWMPSSLSAEEPFSRIAQSSNR